MKLTTVITATALALVSNGAFAAGSDTSKPPKKTKTTTECTEGQVWDEETKECVDPQKDSLNDDQIYQHAREFAYAGQYGNAMDLLELAANQNDPRILNYKGFVSRKSGDMETGLKFYRLALTVDPKYNLARSYYGQALIQTGQSDAAREQLAMIADNNGTGTWAHTALASALNGKVSNY